MMDLLLILVASFWVACNATVTYNGYTGAGLSGNAFTGSIAFESSARSALQCAVICSQREFCASFTFDKKMCRGYQDVTFIADLFLSAESRSFVRKIAEPVNLESSNTSEATTPCATSDISARNDVTAQTATNEDVTEISATQDETTLPAAGDLTTSSDVTLPSTTSEVITTSATNEIHPSSTTQCASFEFRCASGHCIDGLHLCDGVTHCSDGSDEANCNRCHGPHKFKCSDGTCISIAFRCDNITNCDNAEDETRCAGCDFPHIRCKNGDCIKEYHRCDGVNDCSDGGDEENCKSRSGGLHTFDCGNLNYIPISRKCDGQSDCPNDSDELNCTGCNPGGFRCISGDVCIDEYRVCDAVEDCSDGSDEASCLKDDKKPHTG